MFDIKGKNVVYVGSYTGVGYQICRQLIRKEIGVGLHCIKEF